MNRLLAFLCTGVALVSCSPKRDQKDTVPPEVRRRIAQAIWPENLFDASGNPERGFIRRRFRPAFGDLHIRRVNGLDGMPNVALYVGQAVVSSCDHCGTYTVAVAERDSAFLSVLGPNDLEYLLAWATTDRLSDSVSLRSLVVSELRATCFIGCDVKQVRDVAEIAERESPFLRPVDDSVRHWRLPRTYSWQRNGSVLTEFAVYSPGFGVYAVRAEYWPQHFAVSVSPVARFVLK